MQQYNYSQNQEKPQKVVTNITNAVDEHGLEYNHDRQIKGQTNFRIAFVMLKWNERKWIQWHHSS